MENLKNLGKTLNKNEQKEVNGGTMYASCADIYAGINGRCNGYVISRCIPYCENIF